MRPLRPTALAHAFATEALAPGDLAVDATCGNGHDTTHLARLVGPQGRVVAFDIQAPAIEETRGRLQSAGLDDGRVHFIQACHRHLDRHVEPSSAALVMFNLGYLPGGDRDLTTRSEHTVQALDAAIRALRPGALLLVTCYPGHPEGERETAAVKQWMSNAANHHDLRVAKYTQPFTQHPAPVLWLASPKTNFDPNRRLVQLA